MTKNILINITTYKRLDMLNNLLKHFKEYDVIIWDDGSCYPIELIDLGINATLKRFPKNYGKKEAYLKFRKIFDYLKNTDYDYYFLIPDDSEPCIDFVKKSVDLWEEIKDERKICLSWANKERLIKQNWTNFKPKKVGNVIKTQWMDLQFICEKTFFKEVHVGTVEKSRWDKNPHLGSGIGGKVSRFLNDYNWGMYHVEGMLKHLGNESSLMNPQERKNTKL